MTELDVTTTAIDSTKPPAFDEQRLVDMKEFREAGYLQEANRQFFHPLGLALAANLDDEKLPGLWVLDYRDDPEGMFYAEEVLNTPDAEGKAMRVANEQGERAAARRDLCGGVIQSIPTKLRLPKVEVATQIDGTVGEILTWTAKGVDTPPDPENWTPDVWYRTTPDGEQERLIVGWARNPVTDIEIEPSLPVEPEPVPVKPAR